MLSSQTVNHMAIFDRTRERDEKKKTIDLFKEALVRLGRGNDILATACAGHGVELGVRLANVRPKLPKEAVHVVGLCKWVGLSPISYLPTNKRRKKKTSQNEMQEIEPEHTRENQP